jgi:hypothetical protein
MGNKKLPGLSKILIAKMGLKGMPRFRIEEKYKKY